MKFIFSISFLLISLFFVRSNGQTCKPVDIAIVVDSHLPTSSIGGVKKLISNTFSQFPGDYAKFALAVYQNKQSTVVSDFVPIAQLPATLNGLMWTWQEQEIDSSFSLGYGADLFSLAQGSTEDSEKILFLVTSSRHTSSAYLTQLLVERSLKTYVAVVNSALAPFINEHILFVGVGNPQDLVVSNKLQEAVRVHVCASYPPHTGQPPVVRTDACNPNPCLQQCECALSCKHQSGYYCVSRDNGYIGKTCNIPAPSVTCLKNTIAITVSPQFVNEYYGRTTSGSFIAMGQTYTDYGSDSYCKATTTTNGQFALTIPLPFTGCGTNKYLAKDASMRFSNVLWMDVEDSTFSIPIPIAKVTCWYNSSYNVVESLSPIMDTVRSSDDGEAFFGSTSVELCKVASICPNACPALFSVNDGAAYTVGEVINLRISVVNLGESAVLATNEFVAIIDELYISCFSQPGSPDLQLLSGGCEIGHLNTRINVAGAGPSVCISFRVPRMQCDGPFSNTFFIHAALEMVHRSNLQRCSNNRGFISSNGRSKRSLASHNSTMSQHSIGPIYVIYGEEGRSEYALFPNSNPNVVNLAKHIENLELRPTYNTPVELNTKAIPPIVLLISAAVLGCLVLMLLVFLSVFFLRRRDVIGK